MVAVEDCCQGAGGICDMHEVACRDSVATEGLPAL
jgi:hypothetical protein